MIPFVQRKEIIMQKLKNGRPITVRELSEDMKVSCMTIRRDLDQLQSEGKLLRSHGWAEPVRTEEYEPSYLIRLRENSEEKKAICKAASLLVNDGDVLFIDVGTTLLHLPRFLKDRKGITILTHWIPQVLELAKYPNIKTVVLGGTLRSTELSLIGMIPNKTMLDFNADICFLSIGGISAEKGVTDYNIEEVEVKKAMLNSSKQCVIAADSTKLGRVAPIKVSNLMPEMKLITDSRASTNQIEGIKSVGLEVYIAK